MGKPLQQFSEGSQLRIVRVEDAGAPVFQSARPAQYQFR